MEYVKSYVTYSELTGERPSFDELVHRLRNIGLRSLMVSLSNLGQILHNDGAGKPEVQAALRDNSLTPGMLIRSQRLRNWSDRFVFFPQQILYAAKLAILHSPDREDQRPDSEFRDALLTILLMATEFLEERVGHRSPEERDRFLLSHVVRDHYIHAQDQLRYMLPRSSLLFRKYPLAESRLREHPDYLNLDGVFKAATGFSLEDYISFGIAVCTWFITQSVIRGTYDRERQSINPNTFLGTTRVDTETAQRLYAELTHTYESARSAIMARGGDPARSTYDFLPFMEKPLYRVREDVVVPFHLGYLEAKFSGGIYWRILDSLEGDDRLRFMRFFGAIYEHYVCKCFERAIPDGSGLVDRLFREATYPVKAGERKTPDLVIYYERSAIFMEIKASRIRLEATALTGDLAAFAEDIERIIVSGARQLTDRIGDFRDGRYTFGDVKSAQIDMIYPVIVTLHSVPESTPFWNYIDDLLKKEDLLQRRGVARLQLIDAEEMEILETILQQGVSLLEILKARGGDREWRKISLKNFIITHYRPTRNEFLRLELDQIFHHAAKVLFAERL